MIKQKIKQLIEAQVDEDGMLETGIKGVQLFSVSESVRCAPVIYEPAIIAIVSGTKEAILDGKKYHYGSDQYMCCTMSLPVEAGTPHASKENPLLGVYIALDTKVMTKLAIELQSTGGAIQKTVNNLEQQGLAMAQWDDNFSDALLRLLQLLGRPTDIAILGESRLRELYYAVLQGQAGDRARQVFGVGNGVVHAIEYLSNHLGQNVTIDEIAAKVGMSRAVLHRKFKQATTMSPIQFVKSMRLNNAAMRIAAGVNVSEAAMEVGYVSTS